MEQNKVCESDYSVGLVEAMDFDQLIVDLISTSTGGADVAEDALEFGSTVDPGSILNSLSSEEEDDGSECNGWGSSKKAKGDRTRTLVSERKRRGRMKEKLYALRALVPNITKMDKASIVGDAVLYVQNLQMQAKKLKAEISDLESLKDQTRHCNVIHHTSYKKSSIARVVAPAPKTITQMDVFRVEEREFYVRLQSSKGEGVAVCLYRALESLSHFVVRSSNLTTVGDRSILAYTLSVGDCQEDYDVPSMKICIARALVSQGFGLTTSG